MTRALTLAAISLAALFLAQGLGPVQVAGSPAPATLVLERLEVRFGSPAHAFMKASLTIHEYDDGNSTIPADALRERLAAPGQEAFRAGVENYTARLFRETVGAVVSGEGVGLGRCVFDDSSLVDAPDTDEYHPPVVLNAEGELSLEPGSFGLPAAADLDRLIPLILSDGARLHRELRLGADPGRNIVVILDAFAGAVFEESGSGRATLLLDNSFGTETLAKNYTLTLLSPSATAASKEAASVRGKIDIPDLGNISVYGTVEFQRADPGEYWMPPPEIQNITTVSGLVLSELARSGLISTDDLYIRGIRPLVADFEDRLASLFSVNLSFVPVWRTDGNLSCTVSAASFGKQLFALDADIVKGALNAGAEYLITIPMEFGWPTTLELVPPAGMVLKGLAPGAGLPGNRTAYLYKGSGTGSLQASLASAIPAPSSDDIRVEVVTDFSRPALGLGELLWSQSTDVPVFVDANVMMGTAAVPMEIATLLPANLSLRYMTADLVRLLLDKKLIGDGEMSSVLTQMKPRIEAPMRAALGQTVRPGIRYVQASLHGYDIERMDGSRPIVVEAWAGGAREKHLDLFKAVRASPGLVSISQDFALKGVAGWNVTYRMRFAPELRLASVDGHGARVTRGSVDGRDFFEVSFGKAGGAANVTAFIEPAPGYLASSLGPQLSPCFVLFIVFLAIAFIKLRKWRKRRKARLILQRQD